MSHYNPLTDGFPYKKLSTNKEDILLKISNMKNHI